MARRLLKEHIKMLFTETKKSLYWAKVKKLPIIIRYIIGVLLMFFGLLGMITPIPAGFIFLILGLALTIGIRRARSWTIGFIHRTRLHILYSKIYMLWQMRKNQKQNTIK